MTGKNLIFAVIALSVILLSVSVASTKIYGPSKNQDQQKSSPIAQFFEGLGNTQQQGTFEEPSPTPPKIVVNPPVSSGGSTGSGNARGCVPEEKDLHAIFTYKGERYGRSPPFLWYWIPPAPGVDLDGLNKFKPKLQAVHTELHEKYKDYFASCTTSAECDAKNKDLIQKPLSNNASFDQIFYEFKKVFYSRVFDHNWESVMGGYYNHKHMGIIPCPFKITGD